MSITAANLKAFLAKRGVDAEVTQTEDTYLVAVSSRTVDDVANLLATIKEPGRFIVSIQMQDITNLLVDSSGLPAKLTELDNSLKVLEGIMTRNVTNLEKTDDKLREQNLNSTSELHKYIDEVKEQLQQLLAGIDERLNNLESKPWWKKW